MQVGGEAPPPRAYAATAVYKTKILVFGGCNGTLASHFRNDLWALDIHLNTWTRVNVGAQVLSLQVPHLLLMQYLFCY
jgi:hypothetical protein